MSKVKPRARLADPACWVADVCDAMEAIAPCGLAQEWDNVGLLVGDPSARVRRVLTCIDLTPDVVDEAIKKKTDFVMAYHPPIFKPVARLRADSHETDALVFRCIKHGIAIYSMHTALDAADGGTNDVIAELCGCRATEPLEYVDEPGVDQQAGSASECKLVVFVPKEHVEAVADAMFEAGAGHIGDYSHCSYRLAGRGTFLGGASTKPAIGKRGRLEQIDEIRLETVVPTKRLPQVVSAMTGANPYDEPAFDIYPLKPKPTRGIGRVGELPKPTTLAQLAERLKRATQATCVQTVGTNDPQAGSASRNVSRVVIVAGAAGSLPFKIPLAPSDCIITGEIRHHDALTITRVGCTAITLGHWASERPVLAPFTARLRDLVPGIAIDISNADRDPFRTV